jgi:hypothetical protein
MAYSSVHNVPDEVLMKFGNRFSSILILECKLDNKEWFMYDMQADVSGLAGLALVCRTCRRFLALPFLYRTVLVEGADESNNVFMKFAKVLVAPPQLGMSFRTFTSNGYGS